MLYGEPATGTRDRNVRYSADVSAEYLFAYSIYLEVKRQYELILQHFILSTHTHCRWHELKNLCLTRVFYLPAVEFVVAYGDRRPFEYPCSFELVLLIVLANL
jgi:hypothetical protein